MNFVFVNFHRIREAKELLLRNSEMSILEIAFAVGFNSKSSFNDAFKKDTGVSPSDFPRKNSQFNLLSKTKKCAENSTGFSKYGRQFLREYHYK